MFQVAHDVANRREPETEDGRMLGDVHRLVDLALRETLFNLIGPDIVGCRFLDLCAGSGSVGIE